MSGFNATKEEVLRIWQNNANRWHTSSSPWRPSSGDVGQYNKLCGDKLERNVLVLGATPEVRDLVALRGGTTVLVDISQSMIECMTGLLKNPGLARETWIKSDWQEALLPEDFFDLVLGDMPWWVVSIQGQRGLRDKISHAMRADGLLVTRVRLRDSARTGEKGSDVILRFLETLDRHPDEYDILGNQMVSYLHDVTADSVNKRIDREGTKKVILDGFKFAKTPLQRKFLEEFSGKLLSADWTSQTRQELLGLIGERFSVVGEGYAEDYDSQQYPVIAWKKNV